MNSTKSIVQLSAAVLVVMMAAAAGVSWAKDPVNTNWQGVAVKGYDPVAYFVVGKPVKGKKEFETSWMGAKWRFSTAEHRDRFTASPEKYAPQYGGY